MSTAREVFFFNIVRIPRPGMCFVSCFSIAELRRVGVDAESTVLEIRETMGFGSAGEFIFGNCLPALH